MRSNFVNIVALLVLRNLENHQSILENKLEETIKNYGKMQRAKGCKGCENPRCRKNEI